MKNKYYLFLFAVNYLFLFTMSNADGYQAIFTPRISVAEEYTDNYLLTDDDDDDKEHAYITTASIGFTAEVLGRSNGMSISYDPSYIWHDKYSDNDAWSHRAAFDCWIGISRNTRLEINDTFLHTEEPITEIENFSEVDTTRRDRQTYYTNSSGVELSHQFGESDSITLGFVTSLLQNDDPELEDNKRYNPSMTLTYWFVPHNWRLELNSSYTRGKFDVSNDFDNWSGGLRLIKSFTRHLDMFVQYDHTYMEYIQGQGTTNNYHIYNPSAGFSYSVAEDINLHVNVGYYILDTENVSNDETGLSAEGEIEKIFERGSIHITGSGGYDESFFGAENLGTEKYYLGGCNAEYAFTRQISGDIYGFYRRDKYLDHDTERKDKTIRAGAALTLQPLRWLSLRFEYSYRTFDSSIDTNDYEENRGLITLTLSPPEPIRLTR